MVSGAVIYVPSFIKIGSGIQKLIGGIHTDTHTDSKETTKALRIVGILGEMRTDYLPDKSLKLSLHKSTPWG
jgi:hypothetical protein